VAPRRTSRSHAAPPYEALEPSRLRCDDRDRAADDDDDEPDKGAAERLKERESKDG